MPHPARITVPRWGATTAPPYGASMSTPSWARPQRRPNGEVIGPSAGQIHVAGSAMFDGGGGGGGAWARSAGAGTFSTGGATDSAASAITSIAFFTEDFVTANQVTETTFCFVGDAALDWAAT